MKTQIEAIAWAAVLGSASFVWSYFQASEVALQAPSDAAIAAEILEIQVQE